MSNYHLLPAATLAALLEAEQAQHAITKNAYSNAANTAATQSKLIDGLREEVADLKAQLSKVAVPVSKIEAERDHFQKMNRDLKDKNVNLIKENRSVMAKNRELSLKFPTPTPASNPPAPRTNIAQVNLDPVQPARTTPAQAAESLSALTIADDVMDVDDGIKMPTFKARCTKELGGGCVRPNCGYLHQVQIDTFRPEDIAMLPESRMEARRNGHA
jgi:hypothetical protein